MNKFQTIKTERGDVLVRHISTFNQVTHYGVMMHLTNPNLSERFTEARIEVGADGVFTERETGFDWMCEHGFNAFTAKCAVREYVQQRFDEDVRYIARKGLLHDAPEDVKLRALVLKLS